MTPEQVEQRLREIEERANRETPGPWYVHNPDDDMSMNVFLVSATPEEPDPWWDGESEAQKVVAITLLQSPPVACVADHRWEENAKFIAHAREDVPWLLSLVRQQQEQIEKLKEAGRYFLNNLPESEIELAREVWGNTQTACVLQAREAFEAVLRGDQP